MLVMAWSVVSLVNEPELVPHTNDTMTLLAVPSEQRLPFRAAVVAPRPVASSVSTVGGMVGASTVVNDVLLE